MPVSCSNYNIAVLTHKREIPETVRLIRKLQLPDRVRIILYIPRRSRDPKGVYPVNKLRNIAIVNTVTTHFLVMDMDMWPTRSLFEEMQKMPSSVLSDPKSAIIVPLLFFKLDLVLPNCGSLDSCFTLYQMTVGLILEICSSIQNRYRSCISVSTDRFAHSIEAD